MVRTWWLSLQARVQSLVGKLRFPQATWPKKKKKREREREKLINKNR